MQLNRIQWNMILQYKVSIHWIVTYHSYCQLYIPHKIDKLFLYQRMHYSLLCMHSDSQLSVQ